MRSICGLVCSLTAATFAVTAAVDQVEQQSVARPRQSPAVAPDLVLPTEAAAVCDLRDYLGLRGSAWEVRGITTLRSEVSSTSGVVSYVIEAKLDVNPRSIFGGPPGDALVEPWLHRQPTETGEPRSIRARLTWVWNRSEWRLKAVE